MWHTPKGIKSFNNNMFGALVAATLAELLECLKHAEGTPPSYHVGVQAFDSLTLEQQLYALHEVGNAIFRDDIPPPTLTAYREASVEAIFRTLSFLIEVDIENNVEYIRPFVLTVYGEEYYGFGPNLQDSCENMEEWEFIIGNLSGLLLYGEDYEDDEFTDLSPEKSKQMYRQSGLDRDYFLTFPPDPPTEDAFRLADDLQSLCRKIITDAYRSFNEINGD